MATVKLKRNELYEALNILRIAALEKSVLDDADNFIFLDKEIISYNDRISIIYPFNVGLTFSVPAEDFFQIISKADSKIIFLKLGKEKLTFKSKSIQGQIATRVNPESILNYVNAMKEDIPQKWLSLPKGFIEGISLCRFSSSKDASNPVLSSIFITGNKMYSSDSIRISEYTMAGKMKEPFLIFAQSANEILKIGEIEKYAISGSWIFFKTKIDLIFACRKVAGNYPNISAYFNFERQNEINKLPIEKIKDAVNITSIMAEGEFDEDKKIDLDFDQQELNIHARKETGWIRETIKFKSKNNFKFSINPVFLNQILDKETSKVFVGEDRILFESDNFKHLIAFYNE